MFDFNQLSLGGPKEGTRDLTSTETSSSGPTLSERILSGPILTTGPEIPLLPRGALESFGLRSGVSGRTFVDYAEAELRILASLHRDGVPITVFDGEHITFQSVSFPIQEGPPLQEGPQPSPQTSPHSPVPPDLTEEQIERFRTETFTPSQSFNFWGSDIRTAEMERLRIQRIIELERRTQETLDRLPFTFVLPELEPRDGERVEGSFAGPVLEPPVLGVEPEDAD